MVDINIEIEESYITWFENTEATKYKIDFSLYYDSNTSKVNIGDEAKKIGAKEHKQLISNFVKWISIAYDDDEFKEYMKDNELNVQEKDSIPVIEIKHNREVVLLTIEQIIIDFFNEVKDLINETLSRDKNSILKAKVFYIYKYNRIQKNNMKKCLEFCGIRVKEENIDGLSSIMGNLTIKETENTVESKKPELLSSQPLSSSPPPSRLNEQPQSQLPPPLSPQSPPIYVTHIDNNDSTNNISYDSCMYVNSTTYVNYDDKLEDILFRTFLPDDELVFNNNNNNNMDNYGNNNNDDNENTDENDSN